MVLRTGASALAITVALAAPAAAELDAREAVDTLQMLMMELDIITSYDGRTDSETEVSLTGVTFQIEDASFRFPQILLTETPDGGVSGVFAPGAKVMIGDEGSSERLSADLITDGLEASFNDVGGYVIAITADRLGFENVAFTMDGAPTNLTGMMEIAGANLRFEAVGAPGAYSEMSLDASFGPSTSSASATNIDDLDEFRSGSTGAGWSIAARAEMPPEIFSGQGDLAGLIVSELRAEFGAANGSFFTSSAVEDDLERNVVDISYEFGGLTIDHAGVFPLEERLYMDGQDLIPDDLAAHLEYDVLGLTMAVRSDTGWGWDDTSSRDVINLNLSDLTLNGRIAVDEASVLTVRSALAMTMDFAVQNSYISEAWSNDFSSVFDLANLSYSLDVSVPLDNVMMNVMQGIPDGILYAVNYSADRGAFGFSELSRYDEEDPFAESAEAVIEGVAVSGSLTSEGFETRAEIGRAEGSYEGYDAPDGISAEMTGARLAAALPLDSGGTLAPYFLEMAVESIDLGAEVWAMIDPAGTLDQSPMALDLTVRGETIANFNPLGFVAFGVGGFSPLQPETLAFDVLVTAVGARLAGTGAFDVKGAVEGEQIPVGTASFEGNGLGDLLSTLGRMGILSDDELSEGQFLLEAFTVEESDGTRRMEVEINDQEHLIVNGQRMQ